MLQLIHKPLNGILDLIFPNLCVACGDNMPPKVHCFCFSCQNELPPSEMHKELDNLFVQRMWGRVPFLAAAAMFPFRKKSPIQRAMYKLKYKNRPDVGQKLGRFFGQQLSVSEHFKDIDCIVPVPLHPKKQKIRGYNQSQQFALGLAEMMEVPAHAHGLKRAFHTNSQTRMRRMERSKNVSDIFQVQQKNTLEGRHVLLVDDILTTGATLEFCGNALSKLDGTKVSMATICISVN